MWTYHELRCLVQNSVCRMFANLVGGLVDRVMDAKSLVQQFVEVCVPILLFSSGCSIQLS